MSYPYTLTLASVKKLKPCEESYTRIAQFLPECRKIDAAKARELGCTYEDIIWIASAVAMDDESLAKRLTGYLNDNAKAVLHIFEKRAPDDDRVRKCIIATDGFLAGTVSEADWREAARAARAAWDARAARAAWAARAARAAWDAWAARDAWDARAARAARDAWDARAARAAIYDWQFDRLTYWLTEESPEPLPMPEKGVPALEIGEAKDA